MPEPDGALVLVIHSEDETGEPSGFDSVILKVPPRLYFQLPDGSGDALLLSLAGRWLREHSLMVASNYGKELHHASWTITADPAQVRTLGLAHNCPSCIAGVDQALAYLSEDADREVAVGQVWFR